MFTPKLPTAALNDRSLFTVYFLVYIGIYSVMIIVVGLSYSGF